MSNRAQFRAVPINPKARGRMPAAHRVASRGGRPFPLRSRSSPAEPFPSLRPRPFLPASRAPARVGPPSQVMAKIKEMNLTTDTSAAGRIAARLKRRGDYRPFTARYPLYGCAPRLPVRAAPDSLAAPRTRQARLCMKREDGLLRPSQRGAAGGCERDGRRPLPDRQVLRRRRHVRRALAQPRAALLRFPLTTRRPRPPRNRAESLPAVGPPEIAFAGRSNVGKSSLINAVTMAPVARQSDKPGKTQSLNFYSLKEAVRLVDLPGYGAPPPGAALRLAFLLRKRQRLHSLREKAQGEARRVRDGPEARSR